MTELENFKAMVNRWCTWTDKEQWSNASYTIKTDSNMETTIRIDETAWHFDASGKMIGMCNFKE